MLVWVGIEGLVCLVGHASYPYGCLGRVLPRVGTGILGMGGGLGMGLWCPGLKTSVLPETYARVLVN